MKSKLRIYFDVLMENSTNESDTDNARRFYETQLSGFIKACQCIDGDDARKIVEEYDEFMKEHK